MKTIKKAPVAAVAQTQVVDGQTVSGDVVGVGAGVDFTNTLVTNHGSLRVSAGGTATNTTVDGGFLEVSAGGKSVGAVLQDESELDVFGLATGTTLKGGDLNVWGGGVLQNAVIDGGSNGDVNDGYIIAGGKAINTTLNGTGAVLNLEPDSTAVGTVANNGSVEFVKSASVSDSATINSGSYEYQLSADSTSKNLTVNSGGIGVIVGTLDGATINQGGLVTASDGTVVKGSIADNGNLTFHLNGTEHFAGNLTGTGVFEVQGGTLVADSALNFNGTAQIDSSSTLELASASNAHVNFGNFESTLKLDHSQSFSGTVAGTAGSLDTIDLADLAFVKGVTTVSFAENAQHTGGVLTVSDQAMGGPVVNLNLLGNYNAAAFTIGADSLVNNGNLHPGTAIHGPF